MIKLLRKTHCLLFCLLILFLPTQLGKHFWPDWALVEGIKVDYLSPTVYFTDLLVLGILVSWTGSIILNFQFSIPNFQSIFNSQFSNKNAKRLFLLFSFFLLNIFLSQNKPVAFLKFLKLVELFLLILYVKNNITIKPFNNLAILMSVTVIYSSLIAWTQFLCQRSIGGIFWWLGERTFTASTPGIAQASLNGRLLLRPYATFSHPNVLGGYLAVILPLIIINQKPKTKNQKHKLKIKNILRAIGVFLGIMTLFITFSRAAWIIGGLGIVVSLLLPFFQRLKKGERRLRRRDCLLLVVLLFSCLVVLFSIGKERLLNLKAETESIKLRRELNNVALLMIKKYPLTGVGFNNFIPSLSRFKKGLSYKELQPAHNIFLLIGAENGLVGLGIFLWLIWLSYKKLLQPNHQTTKQQNNKLLITNYLITLTAILFLGLFDHYFYTLQQGSLLFALVLGMVYGIR